jgi:hypothetical protein
MKSSLGYSLSSSPSLVPLRNKFKKYKIKEIPGWRHNDNENYSQINLSSLRPFRVKDKKDFYSPLRFQTDERLPFVLPNRIAKKTRTNNRIRQASSLEKFRNLNHDPKILEYDKKNNVSVLLMIEENDYENGLNNKIDENLIENPKSLQTQGIKNYQSYNPLNTPESFKDSFEKNEEKEASKDTLLKFTSPLKFPIILPPQTSQTPKLISLDSTKMKSKYVNTDSNTVKNTKENGMVTEPSEKNIKKALNEPQIRRNLDAEQQYNLDISVQYTKIENFLDKTLSHYKSIISKDFGPNFKHNKTDIFSKSKEIQLDSSSSSSSSSETKKYQKSPEINLETKPKINRSTSKEIRSKNQVKTSSEKNIKKRYKKSRKTKEDDHKTEYGHNTPNEITYIQDFQHGNLNGDENLNKNINSLPDKNKIMTNLFSADANIDNRINVENGVLIKKKKKTDMQNRKNSKSKERASDYRFGLRKNSQSLSKKLKKTLEKRLNPENLIDNQPKHIQKKLDEKDPIPDSNTNNKTDDRHSFCPTSQDSLNEIKANPDSAQKIEIKEPDKIIDDIKSSKNVEENGLKEKSGDIKFESISSSPRIKDSTQSKFLSVLSTQENLLNPSEVKSPRSDLTENLKNSIGQPPTSKANRKSSKKSSKSLGSDKYENTNQRNISRDDEKNLDFESSDLMKSIRIQLKDDPRNNAIPFQIPNQLLNLKNLFVAPSPKIRNPEDHLESLNTSIVPHDINLSSRIKFSHKDFVFSLKADRNLIQNFLHYSFNESEQDGLNSFINKQKFIERCEIEKITQEKPCFLKVVPQEELNEEEEYQQRMKIVKQSIKKKQKPNFEYISITPKAPKRNKFKSKAKSPDTRILDYPGQDYDERIYLRIKNSVNRILKPTTEVSYLSSDVFANIDLL